MKHAKIRFRQGNGDPEVQDAIVNEGTKLVEEGKADKEERLASEISDIRQVNRIYALILFAIIIMSFLIVTLLGINSFKSLQSHRETSLAQRLETQVVTSDVRSFDSADAISREAGPEGDALVLTEHLDSGDYQTRVYLYQGNLVQEYAAADSDIDPTKASVITSCATFEWSLDESGLLSIDTDTGTTRIYVHSEQGGE